MSVKIKLRREGGKKKPFYKIIVIDSRKPASGKFLEQVGYYQPIYDPYIVEINKEACLKWIKKGAQLSDTVKIIFKKAGIFENKEKK
ncbi:MAG: 30S ribosomal protein S16 [Candidatus Caldatribacteriota bacterium]|nr:30S ribosomal protein S16 [Candidatus Caldatribacteriota bacterium]